MIHYAQICLAVLGCLLIVAIPAWGADVKLKPEVVIFQGIALGDTAETELKVLNPTDSIFSVSSVELASGSPSVFSIFPTEFEVAAGDSLVLTVRFIPERGGTENDALVFISNVTPDPSLPPLAVTLSGVGTGPEIVVSPQFLTFASPGIGMSVAQQIQVSNAGNDTLVVSQLVATDSRFQVSVDSFSLGSNGAQTFDVT